MAALLRTCLSLIVVLCAVASARAASLPGGPKPHADAADVAGSPLDLQQVTLGQQGTELVLSLTTAADWDPRQLRTDAGRSLCVRLHYGRLPNARGRICVVASGTEASLRYTRLDPFGSPTPEIRALAAIVSRPDARSLEATFSPAAVNLNVGRYSWQAESRWTCPPETACVDRLPDNGNVIGRIRPLVTPRCFGAAARNPRRRCRNAALRLAVVPTPQDALISPNSACQPIAARKLYPCAFGSRRAVARRTFALVGDSHAAHWRSALEVVARTRGWRGISLSRSGCPYSTARPDLSRARRSGCAAWRRAVRRWFADRPSVDTVFFSQLAGADLLVPGRDSFEGQVAGYIRAWRRLPRSVRHIIVIRDTPTAAENSPVCIQRAMSRGRRAGLACAIPRAQVLPPDPAAAAVRRMRSPRVKVIDLSPFMCSRRFCFPVVGGALVHKDKTHLTEVFGSTLGPFLLRRINQALDLPR